MKLTRVHAQIGYQSPDEREACRDCQHVTLADDDRPGFAGRWVCQLHKVEVRLGGICRDYSEVRFSLYRATVVSSGVARKRAAKHVPNWGRVVV